MIRGHWTSNFKRKPKEERTGDDGITHSSVAQMNRWHQLKMLESRGDIKNLRREVSYPLVIMGLFNQPDRPVMTAGGKQVMRYIADFVYEKKVYEEIDITTADSARKTITCHTAWAEVIEEYKGFMAEDAMIKIRVFEAIYGVKVYINKGKRQK